MDSSEKKKSNFRRLISLLFPIGRSSDKAEEAKKRSEKYRRMYECFREILSINDSTLQLIADIDDKLLGQGPFSLEPIIKRMRRAVRYVFQMVNDLAEISDGGYVRLYDSLGRIQLEMEAECADKRLSPSGPIVAPLTDLRATDGVLAGAKMANLGEMKSFGFNIPEGFAITTTAFSKFMTHNNLWDKIERLEAIMGTFTPALLDKACREVQMEILAAPVPPEVEGEIFGVYDEIARGEQITMAMRSSAVGEDSSASHAGQYYTELNVPRDLLLDSYRAVMASMFKSDPMLYRFERGLNDGQNAMAVGCIRMVDAKSSGIMFSREFDNVEADRVIISAKRGLSAGVTSGTQGAEEIIISSDTALEGKSTLLCGGELESLRQAARSLERHFGSPQDIEWAIDNSGKMYILQSRPMVVARKTRDNRGVQLNDPASEPILSGGYVACPGVGAGPVYHVRNEADLERFPQGHVIVAHHSSPTFSRAMTRCAAIITEIGSPIGHMAILAREFGVPAIVGIDGVMDKLAPGRVVTVNATARQIFDGQILEVIGERSASFPLADSPIVQRLRRIARFISPLNLTDPTSPDFKPAGCKSLHDITRFVHEKVYDVMFHFGATAERHQKNSFKLDAYLPLDIKVFDVGGGVAEGAGASTPEGVVKPEDILSVPMKAFMEGLLDSNIKWDQPRPISARGFLSVLGENMAGPPAIAKGVGSASFVVISDRYMNFSTKAGYHFSTVDVYCGKSQNKNYIHFRFEGGGAALDRRLRRIKFIAEVLSNLDFRVKQQGDFLVARLDKYDPEYIKARLTDLGRLTLCARQLDMLMDSDSKASNMAQAFLKKEFHKF